jgi:enoyl-CoA hydratase
MSDGTVHVEREEGLVTLRLDRPPANAIDLDFGAHLDDILARIEKDDENRALILTGTGSCFCAGLDLKVIPGYDKDQQRRMVELLNRLLLRLYAFPLPTVAALNGHAVAGGMILALCCDYRIAPRGDSRFGLAEVRVGIPYPVAAMAVVLAELPRPASRYLVQLGRNLDPEEAVGRGVLDELAEPGMVIQQARQTAREFTSMPNSAYSRQKRQARAEVIDKVEQVIAEGSDPALTAWIPPETAGSAADVLSGRDRV